MGKKVYIPLDIEKEGKQFLLDKGYDIIIAENVEKETLMKGVADCDAILTRSNAFIDADIIGAAKKLKVISKYGVGVNNIDIDTATENGIYVTNTPEANINAVAEFVMSLILGISKKLIVLDKQLRNGNFTIRNEIFGEDLEGKTLGIIGLGRIGSEVANKAYHGFNMNIMGYDPYAMSQFPIINQVDHLDELLAQSDFVTLHLPLLESTRHVMGMTEFKRMKKIAYLIHASRGGVVDEGALVEALKTNEIAGAAIDVFEVEPPDTTGELFTLDNVMVTPHSAALSKLGTSNMSLHAAMQIDQVLSGDKPSWPVNNIEMCKK